MRPTREQVQEEYRRRQGVVVLDPKLVKVDFARRREIAIWLTAIGFVVVALAWLAQDAGRIDNVGFMFVFLAVLGVWIPVVGYFYRCPQCGELPMTGSYEASATSLGHSKGLDLMARECAQCGARLR